MAIPLRIRALSPLFPLFFLCAPDAAAAPIDDLCGAAESGDAAAAQAAIDAGADVDATVCGGIGATPLHRAAWGGHLDVAMTLVAAGANVNLRQTGGASPLHIAMKNTYGVGANIVNFLLSHNADVNAQEDDGATPLLAGLTANSLSRNRAAFEALLANGADPNLADNRGGAPLHVAATLPSDSFFYTDKLLTAGAKVDQPGIGGRTALHNAAQWGTAGVVNLLLNNGANVHAKTDSGETALQLSSSEDVLRALRTQGACEADKRWDPDAKRCAEPPPPPPPPTSEPPPPPATSANSGGGGGGGAGLIVAGGLLIVGAAWFLSDDAATLSFSPKAFYESGDGAEFSGFGGRMDWRNNGNNLFWEAKKIGDDSSLEFGGAAEVWKAMRIRGTMKARGQTKTPEWRAGAEWRGGENFRLYAEKASGRGGASWGMEWRGAWEGWSARFYADGEERRGGARGGERAGERVGAEAAVLF